MKVKRCLKKLWTWRSFGLVPLDHEQSPSWHRQALPATRLTVVPSPGPEEEEGAPPQPEEWVSRQSSGQALWSRQGGLCGQGSACLCSPGELRVACSAGQVPGEAGDSVWSGQASSHPGARSAFSPFWKTMEGLRSGWRCRAGLVPLFSQRLSWALPWAGGPQVTVTRDTTLPLQTFQNRLGQGIRVLVLGVHSRWRTVGSLNPEEVEKSLSFSSSPFAGWSCGLFCRTQT